MKQIILKIFFVLTVSSLLLSCRPEVEQSYELEQFKIKNTVGYYIEPGNDILFNENDFQEAISSSRKFYRFQRDDRSVVINLQLSSIPVKERDIVRGNIKYINKLKGINLDKTVNLSLIKIEKDLMWLWNQDDKEGYLIRKL